MTHKGETFEPKQENYAIYNELYRRVYLRMYSHLKPLYDEIRAITGYPPKD
jgi:sugar (pentulose or hexulose) kinase